ncbi:hypothetical protein ABIB85_008262 [Bradyrhizobium sp. JR1.5]|uniref:helix-turn-helix domain-containing protein n=1 Tax=unclassified Bradyrhizobium TaxID=2631580 RepID=UPI0033997557
MKIPEMKTTLASMPRDDGEDSSVEESETQSEFGAELRRLRLACKLTIRAVAEALDIHASLLASVEKTSLGVDIPLLKRLASFYEVTAGADHGRRADRARPRDRYARTGGCSKTGYLTCGGSRRRARAAGQLSG